MKGLFLVEPAVALYAFANMLAYPLLQQYIYRRLWQQLTNSTYPATDETSRCNSSNANLTSDHEDVQKAASMFSLYVELSGMIPSLVVTLILVAYSDHRGRKMTILLPVIGSLIYSITFLCVSFFNLDIYMLVAANVLSSLFGGFGTFLGGCFSYVADLCQDGKKKTLRMAGVDMVLGFLSGVASLLTGYFLRAAGFNWPFFVTTLFHCINILYIIFILEETVQVSILGSQERPTQSPFNHLLYGIYQLFVESSRKTIAVLVLLLSTFTIYCFANMGATFMFTLYELNEPLCWSEVLIGYGSTLSTMVFLSSFAGVYCFSRCLPEIAIVLIGLLSVMAGNAMAAFSKTTLLIFLVRIPLLLAIMPAPVLRSMMSKIVPKSKQGALFACVAFLESLSSSAASAVFNSIYAATVTWFSGFCFLVASILCLIPMILMG
ncbi:S46A3 protein, partial [Amia calva]|nr:S46A3 protein [Amia calva]